MSDDAVKPSEMVEHAPLWTKNNRAVPVGSIPNLDPRAWHDTCVHLRQSGCRVVALFASPIGENQRDFRLIFVVANDAQSRLGLVSTQVPKDGSFPSLTPSVPQAQAFERDIYERTGLVPEGHPWLKPLRRHSDLETHRGANGGPAHDFGRFEGADIHEVAVGPVHAGIIEPGHFRFQCHGETVLSLEIQLGYQKRGAEALLLRSGNARRLCVAESVAGDTSVGHAVAYCSSIEALGKCEVPLGAQRIRGIALELERLANHVGDLGALCNDVGYLPSASYFGRLRGEFLNMLCTLCGNRFGRGLVTPGGVRFGLSEEHCVTLLSWLNQVDNHVNDVAELMFEAGSVCSRFEQTGHVPLEIASDLGLVGPVARASGCSHDVRCDHAYGAYRFAHIPVSTAMTGDVMGRAFVRWLESQRSAKFVKEELRDPPTATLTASVPPLTPDAIAVSLVEGWRGEIAHVAITSTEGALIDYRIFDPSIHNWFGLAMALRGQQISDFPLCNKSFNLSYCGHDL